MNAMNVFSDALNDYEEGIKSILLDTNVKGRPPIEDRLKEYVKNKKLDVGRLEAIFLKFIEIGESQNQTNAERQLFHVSVELLGEFSGNKGGDKLISIIKYTDNDNLRRRALSSIVKVKNDRTSEFIEECLLSKNYDDLDRRSLYESIRGVVSTASNGVLKDKYISMIRNCFEIEKDESNQILLDKLLCSQDIAHIKSINRQKFLEKLKNATLKKYREYAEKEVVKLGKEN